MLEVILNFIMYFFTIIFYWKRYKSVDNGFILLFVYSAIALVCVFNYISNPNDWIGLSIFPLIYLFIVNILFFRPFFFKNSLLIEKVQIQNSSIYNLFIYVYIISAFVILYYGYNSAIDTIFRGEWSLVRNDVYSGDMVLYQNQLERFAKIFSGFLQPTAILFFFYLLTETKVKSNKVTIFLLLFAILLPSFITIISVASRGLVVVLVIQFLVSYFVFKRKITKKTNKIIRISSLAFLVLFLVYSISVTKSRFGENISGGLSDDAESSLLFYFGHSMLTFADGLTDTIREFLWGDYLLGNEEILKVGIDNLLGTHFETKFYTFVGSLYLDFGPFFTFIIAIFFPFLISLVFKYKKKIDMADLMIYVYYLTFLINGVFVVGIGYYLGWVIIFIIYGLFKLINILE
ncbi:O-antigen polymerase [Chryseobacterium hagamense]|uniref:Oligosaccharide repeat unit polymerase n=1 Tax=Chryseobacterium hagamense TaxID=395935 RepID=A0A511YLZ2_9FLAO|nr:O-antigen polymerase [Chryseobacterium hagamense]GEN76166.1 hypothetical protein CHA01nite_19060 [Chryseobacterium hagamense]